MSENAWYTARLPEAHAMRHPSMGVAHCPADTLHLIVGAGDGPCWVLMIGGRVNDGKLRFSVSEEASRYGASVARETTAGEDAWSQVGWALDHFEHAEFPWPPGTTRP